MIQPSGLERYVWPFAPATAPRGRYDDERSSHENAYHGSYWLGGDRIGYLYDLGFCAFGTINDDQF